MAMRQITILALAFIIALDGSLLSAQTNPDAMPAMSWPMQPGESLNDIARLFYPKNKYMQQQFVVAAIKLNRKTQPGLTASSVFSQGSSIDIPNIKSLSQKSRSYSMQLMPKSKVADVAVGLEISAKTQADYEGLVKRNTLFKQELDSLNVKLAYLQQVFSRLKVDLLRLIEVAEPAVVSRAGKLIDRQKTMQQTQNKLPVPTVAITQKSTDLPAISKASVNKVQADDYNWLMILSAIVVVGLLAGLVLYKRRQAEKIKRATDIIFEPLNNKAFNAPPFVVSASVKANLLAVQSKFSDSVWQLVTEAKPENIKGLDEKEEGKLMLEQAKIYANLDRHDDAIKLLNAYIKASPKLALQHWLYLLDIYRKTNQKEVFLESAQQLHLAFNVIAPQWEQAIATNTNLSSNIVVHSLEEYDYIVNKVTRLWADCEKEANKIAQTKSYLDALLMDNRNSERAGFSMDVFEDIILLRDMLDAREKLAQEV